MITKILIVSCDRLLSNKLRSSIDHQSDMQVICDTADISEANELARSLLIDIVVVVHATPNVDGFSAARRIISVSPQSNVVVLLAHSSFQYSGVMLSAQASDYHPINCTPVSFANELRKRTKPEHASIPEIPTLRFNVGNWKSLGKPGIYAV